MVTYWDILPRDLQTLIAKIALLEEKATKIQRTLRANRPMLNKIYIWPMPKFASQWVYGYKAGDKVLVYSERHTGRHHEVGYVDKVGGQEFLYDCRVRVPVLRGNSIYYKTRYYYTEHKRLQWMAQKYPSTYQGWHPMFSEYPIKSVTVIQT
jgi:hypothetical protein